MTFWIFFVCVCIGFVFLERIVPERYKMFVPRALMFFITFIAAFRYQIGWDYDGYARLFYTIEIGESYQEPTFQWIVVFLRDSGFDFQMMFVVYSVLTFGFAWFGLKYYLVDKPMSLKILLFTVGQISLFWMSFATVRQALAVAIFFWGSKFILEQRVGKYIMSIVLASFVHYSAIVFLPLYWVVGRSISKHYHIVLVLVSIMVSLTTLVPNLLTIILENIIGRYSTYVTWGSFTRQILDVRFFIELFIWGIIICFRKSNENREQEFIFNMYTLGFALKTMLFWSDPLVRIVTYLLMFTPLVFLLTSDIFNKRSRQFVWAGLVLVSSVLFLHKFYSLASMPEALISSAVSASNINYTFNFKLFQ